MNDQQSFSRNDNPPKRTRVIPVRRVDARERLTCLCLSPTIQGFDFHWTDEGTQPCTKGKALCQLCLKEWPWKWYGFLHVLLYPARSPCFLQLTDFAWRNLQALAKDLSSLRGVELHVQRERDTIRAPIQATISSLLWIDKSWPKEQRVEPTLMTIFKFAKPTDLDG